LPGRPDSRLAAANVGVVTAQTRNRSDTPQIPRRLVEKSNSHVAAPVLSMAHL
jgi:hypothetical protein